MEESAAGDRDWRWDSSQKPTLLWKELLTAVEDPGCNFIAAQPMSFLLWRHRQDHTVSLCGLLVVLVSEVKVGLFSCVQTVIWQQIAQVLAAHRYMYSMKAHFTLPALQPEALLVA